MKKQNNIICERIHLEDVFRSILWLLMAIFVFSPLIFLLSIVNSFHFAYLVLKGEPVGSYTIFDFFKDKKLRYKR